MERLDQTNVIIRRLEKFIEHKMNQMNLIELSINDLLEKVYNHYSSSFYAINDSITEDYINAITLWKFCEAAESEETSSKS